MRVYEVADAVGFRNTKYFFQVFRELTGQRPREYHESKGNIRGAGAGTDK